MADPLGQYHCLVLKYLGQRTCLSAPKFSANRRSKMVSPGSHVINPYQSTEVVSPQGVSVVVYRGLRSEQLDDTRQLARTILFLPYWGGSARTFQYVQEGLAKIRPDFTTIAVSYPGTGHSTLGRYDEEQPWSIENLSSEIASLIFDLSGSGVIEDFNLTICGHSMGGKVALALLSKMIDTHFRIENVVLLAPAPPGPLVLPDEVRETSLSAYANEENVRRAVATVLTECALSEDDIARVVEDSVSMQGPAKTGWLEYGMAGESYI